MVALLRRLPLGIVVAMWLSVRREPKVFSQFDLIRAKQEELDAVQEVLKRAKDALLVQYLKLYELRLLEELQFLRTNNIVVAGFIPRKKE